MAISRLKHQEVVGRVQEGQTGLGRSETPLFWSKASKEEHQSSVSEPARRLGLMGRGHSQARLSFLIRST